MRLPNIIRTYFAYVGIAAALLFSNVTTAQLYYQAPDYDAIKQVIEDKESYYYYPHLFSKYQAGDSTLDLKAYRMLYYGNLFRKGVAQKTYAEFIAIRNEMYMLSRKKKLKGKKLEKMILLTKENLETNPFSISNLAILNVLMEAHGEPNEAAKYLNMAAGVRDAIMSTGDGETEQTAFHIVSSEHEYDLLWVMDLDFTGERKMTKSNCEYLEVEENEDGINGVYFNVNQLYVGDKQ